MKKPTKRKTITPEELIKNFEKISKEKGFEEVTKEDFNKNLKKLVAPKQDKK